MNDHISRGAQSGLKRKSRQDRQNTLLGGEFYDQNGLTSAWLAWIEILKDAIWSSKYPPNKDFREMGNQPEF